MTIENPEHEFGLSDDQFRRLTMAMRLADKAHETSGGGTRHYLRDCFLPELHAAGLRIVEHVEPMQLRAG